MKDPFDRLGKARHKLKRSRQPRWTSPMLATLSHDPFSDEQWIFERKLDGVRCLSFRARNGVRLLSRNKKMQNDTYPEIVEVIAAQQVDDFIVDGEIVAFTGNVTSFRRLQGRMHIKDAEEARQNRIAVYYYLFDILYLDGRDTTKLPLRDRKSLLQRAFRFEDPLRFTRHRNGKGERFLKLACHKGWEGIIAKKAASTYAHKRSKNWLKFKCVKRQELVIGGYTEPQGQRKKFGALLLGYYCRGKLCYAGKVGTGFDRDTLDSLYNQLSSRESKHSPFTDAEAIASKPIHWVSPELVAEMAFTDWTRKNRLRHPRYLGLREDKTAKNVRKEG